MKIILETPRLILREMTADDYPALAAILRDEQTMYAYEGAFSESETQSWLDKNLTRYHDDGIGLWAAILKESGSMIGLAGLTWQDIDGKHVPEVGYLFNRAYWGNGYATEAAVACKDYGFNRLGFDEIYSIIRDTNIASINVAIRNSMIIRERFIKHYRSVDMPHYAFAARNKFQHKLEEMSEFFNTRADRYDTVHIEHIDGGAESKKILAGLLPAHTARLLDIGIGMGLELEEIFNRFPDIFVTGYDIAVEMLRKLSEKHPGKRGQLDLRPQSYLTAKFDRDYDAAMSVMTLHHYDHAAKTAIYRKILDALCYGGIYIEADYMLSESVFEYPEAEERRLFAEYAHLRTEQELDNGTEYHFDTPCTVANNKRLLADAGFTDICEVWSVKNTTILTARKPM